MNIETATQQFLLFLRRERGCTDATCAAYGSDLRRCIAYLRASDVDLGSESLTPAVLRTYVSSMAGEGYSGATIHRRISTVSSFCRWLIVEEVPVVNPCLSVVLPRKRRRMPSYLTLEEAQRVLAAAEEHSNPRTAFCNRAVIPVLLFCGLRRAELLDLKVSDVDLRSRRLKVRRGKGVKGRSVPLVKEAAEAVADWLEFRPVVEHGYLYTGKAGMRLGKKGLTALFARVSRWAEVAREGVTLHTLRHSFASLLLQHGCDLVSIQEMLGHADLATTSVYLHLDASRLKAAVERHPLAARRGTLGGSRSQGGPLPFPQTGPPCVILARHFVCCQNCLTAAPRGASQTKGHALGCAGDLVQVVVQVYHRRLQVLVVEEQLDLADVQAALQPAFRSEATEAVQRVPVLLSIAQARGTVHGKGRLWTPAARRVTATPWPC